MTKNTILIFMILLSSCTKNNVEVIDLSGLNLTQIPDSVFSKTELKELYLGAKEIVFYPPLSAMPQDSCNNLTELDSRISQLINLKVLNLTSNRLKELPASIIELKNLEELDLSLNHDLNIVNEISKLKQLPKLKTLKIVGVQFRQQGEIVKQALELEPRVRVITSIDEYFSLDSVNMKKSIDSLVKNLKIKPPEN